MRRQLFLRWHPENRTARREAAALFAGRCLRRMAAMRLCRRELPVGAFPYAGTFAKAFSEDLAVCSRARTTVGGFLPAAGQLRERRLSGAPLAG